MSHWLTLAESASRQAAALAAELGPGGVLAVRQWRDTTPAAEREAWCAANRPLYLKVMESTPAVRKRLLARLSTEQQARILGLAAKLLVQGARTAERIGRAEPPSYPGFSPANLGYVLAAHKAARQALADCERPVWNEHGDYLGV